MNSKELLEKQKKLLKEYETLLKEQEEREKALKAMPLAKHLACELHDTMCHYSHTDVCGWMYEITNGNHDWNGFQHKDWLAKAEKAVEIWDKTFQEKFGEKTIPGLIDLVRIIR